MAEGEALTPILDAPPMPEMCEALSAAVNAQDRAAHFEREFGADGGGLRCEALVAAAKAAMARAVALAAIPGPEQDHLRRGRGRWHRSRLYHAMRQVYLDADLLKSEGDVLRDAERALLLARGRLLDSYANVEAVADLVWDEVQALAGVRAETTPHADRREKWLTADLRYGGCERHLLPLIDADLNDPVMVQLLNSKSARQTPRQPPLQAQQQQQLQQQQVSQQQQQQRAEVAAETKRRLRRRPAGPSGSAAEISARRAAEFAAEEAVRMAEGVNSSTVPPPPGGHLSATSWTLVLLLAVPAAGLVALQASPHIQGRLPPIDLRQWLRNAQSPEPRAAPARSMSSSSTSSSTTRKGKGRKGSGKAAAAGRPLDGRAAAKGGRENAGSQPGGEAPATPPPPPPIRKQRSRGRGDSSTEGDAGSTASSASGLPPDTPAQGRRPPARHAREDSSPDDSPRSSASSGQLRTPFAPAVPPPPPHPPQQQRQAPQKRAPAHAKPAPNSRPSATSAAPRAAARSSRPGPGPVASAAQPAVSRTADLPAADRPVERSSRRTHRPPPPPGSANTSAPAGAASAGAAFTHSHPHGAGVSAATRAPAFSRPLQPNARPFQPRAGSPSLQGRQPPVPQLRQHGHPLGQHPHASPLQPQQQPQPLWQHHQPAPGSQRHQPGTAVMAPAPSDDIDDILADAWAFTNESAPPQRPPLGLHSAADLPASAAAALQHPSAAPAPQQQPHFHGSCGLASAAQPSPLPPSLRSISRTISSASSDATAASLPPYPGLSGGAHPAASGGAFSEDGGHRPARGGSAGNSFGATPHAADGHPAAASSAMGLFSSPGLSTSDMPVEWDGRRSGTASPALPADATAGPSAVPSSFRFAASASPPPQPPQHAAETTEAFSQTGGAFPQPLLPDDLLEPLGGESLARETIPSAAACADGHSCDVSSRDGSGVGGSGDPAVPPRAPGSGPLQQEPWPPARADAPGMRARLGSFQSPASRAVGIDGAGAATSAGASGGVAALQTAAAAQFAAQRGLLSAAAVARATGLNPGLHHTAPLSPSGLPQLALPSSSDALHGIGASRASAPCSPAALTPAAAAAAQYQLWGAALKSELQGGAVLTAPGSPVAATSCGSPFAPRPLSPATGSSPLRSGSTAFLPGRSHSGDA